MVVVLEGEDRELRSRRYAASRMAPTARREIESMSVEITVNSRKSRLVSLHDADRRVSWSRYGEAKVGLAYSLSNSTKDFQRHDA